MARIVLKGQEEYENNSAKGAGECQNDDKGAGGVWEEYC